MAALTEAEFSFGKEILPGLFGNAIPGITRVSSLDQVNLSRVGYSQFGNLISGSTQTQQRKCEQNTSEAQMQLSLCTNSSQSKERTGW